MFCTMEVGIMEAAVAVGTFIRIEANKSCHSRSLLLRHHHHHEVLGCNSKPGALHCKLKMGFSQNGCLSSLRVVVPPATAATGFKPLSPLKLVANLSRMGKVNASKVNGTKVEIGKKSSLDREEEEHGSKSMFSSMPPAVAADLESYVQNPAMQAVLVAMANVALLAVEKKQQQQITTIAAGKTEVPVDALRQGRLVEARLVYRQTFVIRSYEVGADKTASIETLMNHFQETALNHVWMAGLAGDGFGATHSMICHNLIWVVSRMQVQVEQYPAWGDVVEMDTWVAGSGKNGMRRDWLVRDYKTGQILARATSTWVMMNKKTRRFSKMPNEVRGEISPHFLERSAIDNKDLVTQKIKKLGDDSAQLVCSGLTPRRNDLDMNQHVNNVKYIGWMMESIPNAIQESHELETLVLEYRRECGQSEVVQSLASTESSCSSSSTAWAEAEESNNGCAVNSKEEATAPFCLDGSLSSSELQEISTSADQIGPLQFTHLLRLQVDGVEIVRGSTLWRLKKLPFHTQ
ncbi:hypothetical protein BDL97_18G043800 [Sphagnum fallax]|nr:hypothetical protein BDL97_18G043800 [Sphagnum fallax]